MVKSGLVDRPDVSHFRLAAHLCLALFIFSYLFWLLMDLVRKPNSTPTNTGPWLVRGTYLLLGLSSLQFVYGAFTAGLKGGHIYNTFPDMNGALLPKEALLMNPWLINFFENVIAIQFTHRSLAWTLALVVIFISCQVFSQKNENKYLKTPALLLGLALFVQFFLGVVTLIANTPLSLAITHQSFGFFFLLAALNFSHRALKP